MSLINDRITPIRYTHSPNEWANMPQKIKDSLQKINKDSDAYHHQDEKCYFCNLKITKNDTIPPNIVYESGKNKENVSHGRCLEYVTKKYPLVPFTKLQGKIVGTKVN